MERELSSSEAKLRGALWKAVSTEGEEDGEAEREKEGKRQLCIGAK